MPNDIGTSDMMTTMSPEQMLVGQQQIMDSHVGPNLFLINTVLLCMWAFFSYCLYILAKKLGEKYAWMAWLPFFNMALMFRMAKMSLWSFLGMYIPFLNIYILIKMMHVGISKRTGHGAWWTVGLFFLSFIFFPITAFTYKPADTSIEKNSAV